MTAVAYRIVKRQWVDSAFDGEGARSYPGRWNSSGTAMVYTAASRALALLEMLVNFPAEDLLRHYFAVLEVRIPEACILDLGDDLPKDWRMDPPPLSTRAIGDEWVGSRASVALAVPSAVVPAEINYLLNPSHPDFSRLEIGSPEDMAIDPRLGTGT